MTKNLKVTLAALAGYSALTVVMTYPLVRHLGTLVPHDLGDPLLSIVILWWNAHHRPFTETWWNGSFFWPATGALALSDHRLGESLLASPLQWAGFSPLTAYNLTLLSTFPASALAAHWLAFTLTRRHDASIAAGLAYGFNPYRFAHLEHLELLAAFGMPVALVALHRYLAARRPFWFVVFGSALLLQALLCSYYFLFFLILLALWVLWFVRSRDAGLLAGLMVSGIVVVTLMSPIIVPYFQIHQQFGLTRGLNDIVSLSADVTSIATASPLSTLWGWTSRLNGGERQLFPGLTIVVLTAAAVVAALLKEPPRAQDNRLSLFLLAFGGVFALIAVGAWSFGPRRVLGISVGTPFKPLSLAFFSWTAAALVSSPVREAYRRRSTLAFYALAAAAMFLLSLGPKPALLNQQILYQPPYAWLMRLSIFGEGVRVPARFGMLMVLALSTTAALAVARFTRNSRRGQLVTALVAAAIVADSWISGLPLLVPPEAWPAEVPTAQAAASLELPLGDTMRDIAAMYRATLRGDRTVNGNSGYYPPHYRPLASALALADETVFDALGSAGPVLVAVERLAPGSNERIDWLRSTVHAREIQSTDRFAFFLAPGRSGTSGPGGSGGTGGPSSRQSLVVSRNGSGGSSGLVCGGPNLPIAGARDLRGPVPLAPLVDGRPDTFWRSGESQRTGDLLILELAHDADPCAVRLSLGRRPDFYPNALSVATSLDGTTWHTAFNGKLGGEAVRATLAHPLDVTLELPLDGQTARYVRMRIERDQPKAPWVVTEAVVVGKN